MSDTPAAPDDFAQQATCDGPFKHHLDRCKYPERFADAQGRGHHRELALEVLLQALEARLRAAPQLGGGAPCATDIGIFPFVRQFAATDPAWWATQPLPAVQAWLTGWLAHPLFERAMRKLPVEKPLRPTPPGAG